LQYLTGNLIVATIEHTSVYYFNDDGTIPNSQLPVIIYRQVCPGLAKADWLEHCFQSNGWTNNWRDSVRTYDHFHSNTHEVLGLGSGELILQIGGKMNGMQLMVAAGDVLVLPAGVGHFSVDNSRDYEMIGGYSFGKHWDMMTGKPEEREHALQNLGKVALPVTDPVFGVNGPLLQLWK